MSTDQSAAPTGKMSSKIILWSIVHLAAIAISIFYLHTVALLFLAVLPLSILFAGACLLRVISWRSCVAAEAVLILGLFGALGASRLVDHLVRERALAELVLFEKEGVATKRVTFLGHIIVLGNNMDGDVSAICQQQGFSKAFVEMDGSYTVTYW